MQIGITAVGGVSHYDFSYYARVALKFRFSLNSDAKQSTTNRLLPSQLSNCLTVLIFIDIQNTINLTNNNWITTVFEKQKR